MMQKEKIVQRSLFIAVAAVGLTMAPMGVKADGTQTPSTSPTPSPTSKGTFEDAGLSKVTMDGTTGVLTVAASSGAKEILVGTGKANVKKKTITVSTWDIYEPEGTEGVEVDLSKLKNNKDNYLVLGTNTTENVSIVKIPIAAKITKVKFDAKKGVLQAGHGANAKEAILADLTKDTGKDFEYRTAYSQWTNIVSEEKDEQALPDFSLYQQNGTQLYVRLKGDNGKGDDGKTPRDLTQNKDEKLSYNGKSEIEVYEAPHLPGKEVKVTIAAMAKGPSLTADFANSMVKIPKNTEYRLVTNTAIYPEAIVPATVSESDPLTPTQAPAPAAYVKTLSDGKAHSITDILAEAKATDAIKTTAALEVRKTETDKKPASKWNRLTIQKLLSLDKDKDYKEGPTPSAEKNPKGGGVNGAEVYEEEGGKSVLTIEYSTTGTKTKSNVIKITNTGKYGYELRVGDKDAEKAPTDGKIYKIAAATTRSKTLTMKNIGDYSSIWIRRAGDKKKKDWATDWAKLGIVDYPYEATAATPTPTSTPTPTTPPT